MSRVDLRIGEFYVWEDSLDKGYCDWLICHTDTNERVYDKISNKDDAEKLARKMNEDLKSRTQPVYNW